MAVRLQSIRGSKYNDCIIHHQGTRERRSRYHNYNHQKTDSHVFLSRKGEDKIQHMSIKICTVFFLYKKNKKQSHAAFFSAY